MFIRFALKAELQFSKEIPAGSEGPIEEAINEANNVLFRRGVPAEATPEEIGRITKWKIDGEKLLIEIVSGPYTRAHDALFRFRKNLAPKMGKTLRLGLRKIEVTEFSVEFPEELQDAAIPKIPHIGEITRKDGITTVALNVDASDLENRIPDRIVRLIQEKKEAGEYGGKGEHWELLYESPKRDIRYSEDPTQEMISRNWIKHGASRGQWIFGPQAVQLFRAFEQIVIDEIIKPLGYSEMIFPKLIPWEVWMKSGHAKGVYPEIYYVSTPKTRDPAYWEDIADYFKVTGEVPVDMIRDRIDGPIGGMCYAQCPPFWTFVQGETLANDCLPILVFDRSGTSHRYESGGIHGIERVDEFHRIEILFLGEKEHAIGAAHKLHDSFTHVFDEILELEWRCARVTPWFMAQEGLTGDTEVSEAGTWDYEALLPYNGNWLEFQNVSVAGDKYPKGFNVKIQDNSECWSGCSGIGLERWTAAFLAQKGFDRENWPDRVNDLVGEEKEVFRFL